MSGQAAGMRIAGRWPIEEPGREELFAGALARGKLTTTQYSGGLVNTVAFAMSQIAEFTRQIAAALDAVFLPLANCHRSA